MGQQVEAIVSLYLARIYKHLPRVLQSLAMPQLALVQDYMAWGLVWNTAKASEPVLPC